MEMRIFKAQRTYPKPGDVMMNRKKWWTYGIFLAVTQAIGGLSALLTKDGMEAMEHLAQSSLTPPGWVFSVVWPILYTLMAIGAARVYLGTGEDREQGLWLYGFQIFFNFFWSLIYFNMQWFGLALLWLIALWLLILWMTLTFRKVDPLAAWLQLPYLAWVAFAGYLNFVVWRLN